MAEKALDFDFSLPVSEHLMTYQDNPQALNLQKQLVAEIKSRGNFGNCRWNIKNNGTGILI